MAERYKCPLFLMAKGEIHRHSASKIAQLDAWIPFGKIERFISTGFKISAEASSNDHHFTIQSWVFFCEWFSQKRLLRFCNTLEFDITLQRTSYFVGNWESNRVINNCFLQNLNKNGSNSARYKPMSCIYYIWP